MWTDAVLERRRPVWLALSEFYLDTELDDADLLRIREVFVQSGYTPGEVRDIERKEVRPVVGVNALDVAGAWEGFDAQWLEQRILIVHAKGGPSIWQRLFFRDGMTQWYWNKMLPW